MRAIDGARTRGLDLGKVARYQLRHYRILTSLTISFCDVPARLSNGQVLLYNKLNLLSTIFLNFFIFLFLLSGRFHYYGLRPAACCLRAPAAPLYSSTFPPYSTRYPLLTEPLIRFSSIFPSLTAATTPSYAFTKSSGISIISAPAFKAFIAASSAA